MKKEFTLLKLYLTIIATVGIIGSVVGYGTAIYQGFKKVIISDNEYIIGGQYRQIQQCEDPTYRPAKPIPANTTPAAKTPEEIKQCQDDATKNILEMRNYEYKNDIITGTVRGTLFLILFVTHLPILVRKSKEEVHQ